MRTHRKKKEQPKCFEAQENVGDQVMIGFSFAFG